MPISRHRPKKGKRPNERDNKPKGKKDFFDTKLGGRVIYAGLIALILAMWSSDDILFYPFIYTVYLAIPFFFLGVFYCWNEFKSILLEKFTWETILVIPLLLVMSITIAALCVSVLVIPFNYYIKESSKNNPIETYRCNIDYVSKNSSYTTYYIFKNETFGQSISYKKAEELKENDNYKNYYVHLEVRKGPFETYVIQTWKHRRKPIL